MQQYSSLPEQNSQLDTTPGLLATIQQLHAELWLERSLNQLQNRLNDCLLSAYIASQVDATEAEIFQTVVNELDTALNSDRVAFTQYTVGIALFQSQTTVGKIYYTSHSLSSESQPLEVMPKKGKKLCLKLQEVIQLSDLQQWENQQPPRAWRLTDDCGGITGWLIITTTSLKPDGKPLKALQTQLKTQLLARAAKLCTKVLSQIRQIQSLQKQSQYLDNSNQELERTNQLKNQFLANTSHEIRTPLSSIIGFTHLLLAQGFEPTRERHNEYLNIIQSSGKHLLALINDILDLSKIEANQLEVQWEIVNLPELCRNVLALVKEKAANKGLRLLLELDPNVTTLVADSLRLKQMLLNLLFNSLKFTSKGTVGLQVKLEDVCVHFIVWDTGTGISKEDQAQLFQPYFQIPNAVTNTHEGTGLGLAVTQKLAQIHGGSVEVESEVDQGSRFTIILPLVPHGEILEDKKDEEVICSSPSPSIVSNSSVDILLVEDDLPNGKLLQIYLNQLGYAVTWVKNAATMWEALTEFEPAVILIDLQLPDDNGLNLVSQLRANQQYGKIPVIAQTAMAMKGDRETCLSAGANEYIAKPIDLPTLATLVAKYSQPDSGEKGKG